MAIQHHITNRSTWRLLPKHGPSYTFYLLTALAILVAVATAIGIKIAAAPHLF